MRPFLALMLLALGGWNVAAKEETPAAYQIPLPPPADFTALDWLVGDWTGKTTRRDAAGEIHLTVSYDLEKRFMVFRESVTLPATKKAPEARESWLGILSPSRESAGYVLRVFSNTGFMTRYRVSVGGAEINFSPEGGELPPPGWLFRRVIRRSGDAEITETVQAAPPNKPFFDYYTAKLTRISSATRAQPRPTEK